MKKLIKNVTVVTMNENQDILKNSNIIINNDIIEIITDKAPSGDFEIFDAKGGVAIPGLVNAHTHVSMTLLRSYADGLPLQTWLFDKIFPIEDKLTSEDIYYGAMIGIMDMLSSGTTLFADMYYFMDSVARAAEESGIKALLCRGVTYDKSAPPDKYANLAEGIEFCKNWTGKGRIKTNLGPHSIYTTTPEFLEYMIEKAKELKCSFHIHLSETALENSDALKTFGKTPTKYLYDLGFFDVPVIAAHCVHLTDEDIEILKSRDVVVAHNPTSNLKLGSGIAPLYKLKNAGIRIALGTDGASSNNNLNMLEEVNLAGLITNGVMQNPTAVLPYDALKWGVNASALGFADTGVLQSGKKADIVIIDTDKPHFIPMHNALSNVVYSANAGDVKQVFADGNLLFNNGEFTTIDKEKIFYETRRCCKRIFS